MKIVWTGDPCDISTTHGVFTRGEPRTVEEAVGNELLANDGFRRIPVKAMYVGPKSVKRISKPDGTWWKFPQGKPIIVSEDLGERLKASNVFVVFDENKRVGAEIAKKFFLERKGTSNVLVIRGGAAGDILMTTPMLRALKQNYDVDITYLCWKKYAPILDGNQYIDRVALLEDRHTGRYDFRINLDTIMTVNRDNRRKHFILTVLDRVGIYPIDKSIDYHVPIEELTKAKKYLKKAGWDPGNILIAFQEEANVPVRTWEKKERERFKTLCKRKNWQVVSLDKRTKGGKFEIPIRTAGALVALSDVVVCPDSLFVHVAGALNKKTVAVFSTIDPDTRMAFDGDYSVLRGGFAPPEEEDPVKYDNKDMINNVKAEQVVAEVERKLSIGKKEVSIIIPVWNNLNLLEKCINAINENTKNINYEIIVIDNNSKPKVPESKDYTVIRNKVNKGFGWANNQGARYAIGKYLVFLNSDTEPMKDWIECMLKVIATKKSCGIVSCKLLYPNMTIQHAGCTVYGKSKSFTPEAHQHRLERRNLKIACTTRKVQRVTGACMLMRRDDFFNVGCFDPLFETGYFEDADLCLRTWKYGKEVWYCGDAEVIHLEAQSQGPDLNQHKINRELFRLRWEKNRPGGMV